MKERTWDINWDYWDAQLEGFKALKKKKKIWREYRNETKELIDAVYEWWWERV
mgnify:FL=1